MKDVLISALALATAMASVAPASEAAQPAAASGPVRLTAAQMDRVTAGLAAVGVSALATAAGPRTHTDTSTLTHAVASRGVEVALGVGHASAVGDRPRVDLSASLHADGDHVFAATFTTDWTGRRLAAGHLLALAVSIDGSSPIGRAIQRAAPADHAEPSAAAGRRGGGRPTRTGPRSSRRGLCVWWRRGGGRGAARSPTPARGMHRTS